MDAMIESTPKHDKIVELPDELDDGELNAMQTGVGDFVSIRLQHGLFGTKTRTELFDEILEGIGQASKGYYSDSAEVEQRIRQELLLIGTGPHSDVF